MAHDEPKTALQDALCGKPETLVHKLIEGPGVFICDECINLCYDLIEQTSSPDIPIRLSNQTIRFFQSLRKLRLNLMNML